MPPEPDALLGDVDPVAFGVVGLPYPPALEVPASPGVALEAGDGEEDEVFGDAAEFVVELVGLAVEPSRRCRTGGVSLEVLDGIESEVELSVEDWLG
jgi:hypothetical protein